MSDIFSGVVSEFDEHVGLGAIAAGSHSYPFHCTQIQDGTRTIEVGASVRFVVVERPKGPEAYEIEKV